MTIDLRVAPPQPRPMLHAATARPPPPPYAPRPATAPPALHGAPREQKSAAARHAPAQTSDARSDAVDGAPWDGQSRNSGGDGNSNGGDDGGGEPDTAAETAAAAEGAAALAGADASGDEQMAAELAAELAPLSERQGIFELLLPGGATIAVVVRSDRTALDFLLSTGCGALNRRLKQNKLELRRRLQQRIPHKNVQIALL